MISNRNNFYYLDLWLRASVSQDLIVKGVVKKLLHNRHRYESIKNAPWQIVAVIHYLESSMDFTKHLHNGDPLTGRTMQVPKGRPKGQPPFTWEVSAEDAIRLKNWSDWSLAGSLYFLEMYNGFGYAYRGINSPYLWSFTQHYTKGKFVRDRVFDPEVKSRQIGAVALLKGLGYMNGTSTPNIPTIVFGSTEGQDLQNFLNTLGADLLVDGIVGKQTSDAFFRFFGMYLLNDPRNI